TPTASDNCDTNVSIILSEDTRPGACPQEYALIRTWTATDDCGNSATVSQTLIVQDTEPPILSGVPQDVTVECNAVPSPDQGAVTASDNCDDNVEILFEENTLPGTCPGSYVVVRTWTASDNCGNSDEKEQRITVRDTEAPEFTNVPQDVTIECSDPIPTDQPTASDNCDSDVSVSVSDSQLPGSCPQEIILTRVWTATDDCGNSATVSRTIIIQDRESPVLSGVPSDVTANCGGDIPPVATVTATDNCDPAVDVVFEESSQPNGNCGETIIRTW